MILHVDLNQKNLPKPWENDEFTFEIYLSDFASAEELPKLGLN